MPTAIRSLLDLLDLDEIGPDTFRGLSPTHGWRRVFGGQAVAQALIAASRTVTGRAAHSLHGYFILPGDPKLATTFRVERVRDGGSFSTRRVVASQDDRAIFIMSASFHRDEDGFDHHEEMPPGVPEPEELPSEEALLRAFLARQVPDHIRSFWDRERPVELRPVRPRDFTDPGVGEPRHLVWFRSSGPMPDDPALHRCVLAYATDFTLLDTALIPHGYSVFDKRLMVASLDHAVWMHRPFCADEWMLYVQTSTNAHGARGFTRGSVFSRSGTLVASVAQEGLIRRRTRRSDPDSDLPIK